MRKHHATIDLALKGVHSMWCEQQTRGVPYRKRRAKMESTKARGFRLRREGFGYGGHN